MNLKFVIKNSEIKVRFFWVSKLI